MEQLLKYYNINNKDAGRIYFTDLNIMLTPTLPIDRCPPSNREWIDYQEMSPLDLILAFFQRECKFFAQISELCRNFDEIEFEEVWAAIGGIKYFEKTE